MIHFWDCRSFLKSLCWFLSQYKLFKNVQQCGKCLNNISDCTLKLERKIVILTFLVQVALVICGLFICDFAYNVPFLVPNDRI